jgi:ankyrin repeat protein
MLLNHGAKGDAENDQGETPLHVVSRGVYDNPEHGVNIARLLLEHGVDLDAQDKSHETALHLTAFYGRPEITQLLLDHGANPNTENEQGKTPLHSVSGGKHNSQEHGVSIARLLLERGAEVDAQAKDKYTPLHLAAFDGRLELAKVLLDHGANANVVNEWGETPLHLVSRGEYDSQEHGVNIARLLLERCVDLDAQTKSHNTALHLTAFYGRPEITQLLLDHGASPNAEDELGSTPLQSVAGGNYDSQEHGVSVARLLLEHGADVNPRTKVSTPLHSAAFYGRLKLAKVLLDHGANANAVGEGGETPLHLLSRGEYDSQEHGVNTARLLLEHCVDLDAQTESHETALHFAAFHGRPGITQLLLDHGANPNTENEQGDTPLHSVSGGKHNSQEHGASVGIARLLLERGVDVDARAKDKFTPLHSATFNGRLELAKVLLDHGANANAVNEGRETPLHLVSRGEYDRDSLSQEHGAGIARLLLEHGVDVHAQDEDLDTALHWAAFRGRLEVTQVLLEHGANPKVVSGERPGGQICETPEGSQEHGVDVDAQGKYHDTPLHWAALSGRVEITRLLLDHGANPNVEDEQQATPLHLVVRGEYDSLEYGVGTARLLLERGVKVGAPDEDRNTPLHLASYLGRLEIAQVLLDHGADAGSENDQAQTPLHLVSQTNYWFQDAALGVAKLLLERGADMNARDQDYATPLHLACYRGRLDIARALLEYDAQSQSEND